MVECGDGVDGMLQRIARKLDVFLSDIVEEHIEPAEEDFINPLLALKEEGYDGNSIIADENMKAIIICVRKLGNMFCHSN